MPCDSYTINKQTTSAEVRNFTVDAREEAFNIQLDLVNTGDTTANVSGEFKLDIGNNGTFDMTQQDGAYLTLDDTETIARTFQVSGLESDTVARGCYEITSVTE